MHVPFLDLKTQYLSIKEEIQAELNHVLDNTAYICGKKVKNFEDAFSQAQEATYCLGLSSGTDALHLAYWCMGIGIGGQVENGRLKEEMDEVIVPVNTYIATTETITIAGAKPVFVDHEEDSFNIDPSKIEEKITPRTRAIVAVHLYGQPADMVPILKIAQHHNLQVIEDCSQAHLARYQGKLIGSFGRVGTFSFYPGKNLGAYGEAGAIITNDPELYEKMVRFRQHGAVVRYVHDLEGHNYRMEEIQGAVLCVKLQYLETWTDKRRKIADRYRELLQSIEEVKTPQELPGNNHVYHLFVIRATHRQELADFLKEKGVDTGFHYPMPLHVQQAYRYLGYQEGDFPVAEKCCREILSIPLYPELTEEQICYVVDSIKQFYSRKG